MENTWLQEGEGIPASNFPTLINYTCVSRDKRYQYRIYEMTKEKFKRAYIALLFKRIGKVVLLNVFVYIHKYNRACP